MFDWPGARHLRRGSSGGPLAASTVLGMAIPQHHPPTVHRRWSDPLTDTFRLLWIAFKTTGWVDINVIPLLDVDAAGHWPGRVDWNHWTWIWTGRRTRTGREIRRRLTDAERQKDSIHWTWAEYSKLRTAERGGPKPKTAFQFQRRARRLGVAIAWDVKGTAYGRRPELAGRLVASVRAAGGRHCFFVLADTAGWWLKIINLGKAGAQVAVNRHGAPCPTAERIQQVTPYADAWWGSWS